MSTEATNEWNTDAIPSLRQPEAELPEIVSAEQFLDQPQEMPAELVQGMIHQSTLTMFSGGSKSFKTFTLMDLGLSVSHGVQWWGKDVVLGRVLYLNFEISAPFFQNRLLVLSDAKSVTRPLRNFDLWNLRGHAADIKLLMPKIIERCRGEGYAMIIFDPIYKLMNRRNENAAGEMAEFLDPLETLAEQTGAAVIYSHHFAKGLASSKEQLDRASGSGVFARHADGIITITPHEEENAFVVEATLRNLRAPAPFVMRWGYPLMKLADELDPKRLKSKVGAKAKYTVAAVVSCLTDGMTTGEWQAAAIKQEGFAASTFAKLKNQAIAEDCVEARGRTWFRKPKVHVFNPMTGESKLREAAPHEQKIA